MSSLQLWPTPGISTPCIVVLQVELQYFSTPCIVVLQVELQYFSTPCIVVLQVELQYLLYIHFGEHMTLAASQITMVIVIGT